MNKKYIRLKATMIEHEVDERYLNKKLNRGARYISAKLNDKTSWKLDEIYTICDILHIPYDEIHLYFPK